MMNPPPTSNSLGHESPTPTITERVVLVLCTLSLAAYLGFSLSVRALVSELIRLTGKFLG